MENATPQFFLHRLTDYLKKAKGRSQEVSVITIEICHYQKISMGLGLSVGHDLSEKFAELLSEMTDEEHMIAVSLERNLFGVAIYAPDHEKNPDSFYQSLEKRLKDPMILDSGYRITITVNAGVASYPGDAVTAARLVSLAEIMMYKGRSKHHPGIYFYDSAVMEKFNRDMIIEGKLRKAVREGNFELFYQPQIYRYSHGLRGAEALIRMRDTDGRFLSPGLFIPIAERSDLIHSIGEWVLEESFRQYADWQKRFSCDMLLSVNISPSQYCSEDFEDTLTKLLSRYQIPSHKIELEVTEGIVIEDFQYVSQKLEKLRASGIRISLDDFGTGYSSLSYLKKLPIDALKIDRSFISDVMTDDTSKIILKSVIQMSKALGYETIAEGVEEEAQCDYLRAVGCDIIQGYLFGRPMSAVNFEEKLLKEGFRG